MKKSVGEEIGERAFAEWLEAQEASAGKADGNAALIVETLWPMVAQGTHTSPSGSIASMSFFWSTTRSSRCRLHHSPF